MTCTSTCIKPSPSQAHCPVCHVTFSGPTLFDAHRRGDVDERYCLDSAAMTDRGKPLHRDAAGVWRAAGIDPTRQAWPYTRSEAPQKADPASGVLAATLAAIGTAKARMGGRA